MATLFETEADIGPVDAEKDPKTEEERYAIEQFKKNVDWSEVFETRNWLNDLHFNPKNPNFVDWNQDIANIQNELVITP